jgi:ubiquinone/menaquinone biosynthesis C-methylase UbiE
MEPSVNAEHIAVWNDIVAPKYIRFRHVFASGLGAHTRAALSKNAPRAGDAVLDVGCGMGESSIELGHAVGPSGSVLGIDSSERFLDIARRDARSAGLSNLRFRFADAQTEHFEPAFDLCFSRFGTMFFSNPGAAMRNLRGALEPGGRLVMLVWRTLDDNEWMSIAKKVALSHLPPPEQAPTCGPGPFSLASRDVVNDILEAAGFRNIHIERSDANVTVGRDLDDAIDFQLALGPAGEIVREAGDEGQAKRPAIAAELKSLLGKYATPEGVIMGSSSWIVTAENGAKPQRPA